MFVVEYFRRFWDELEVTFSCTLDEFSCVKISLIRSTATVYTGVCRIPCYGGVLNDKIIKIGQKQADFTVFDLDTWGAPTPFAPPGYAGVVIVVQ